MFVKEGDTVKEGQILLQLDATRYKAEYGQQLEKYFALLASTARLTAEVQNKTAIDFSPDLKGHEAYMDTEIRLFNTRLQDYQKSLDLLQKSYDAAANEIKITKESVAKGLLPKIDLYRAQRTANSILTDMVNLKNRYREGALTDLNKAKGDLNSLKEALVALKDKMVRTEVRSPVAGVIKKLYIYTTGSVIEPNEPIMEIVPKEDNLLIEARVNPKDIAFVHVGQEATVKISAYDYSIYGSLQGKVIFVSPDAIEERTPHTPGAGQELNTAPTSTTYYLVHVRTDRNYLGNKAHQLPISPGMNATVQIKTGTKTVLQYLLKPLIKAKEEALRER
jgi:adhesin transport system membrane fusion protein